MRTKELPPILFFLSLGLYVTWASRGLGVGTLYRPGPGLMPFYLGLGLVLVASMLLYLSLERSQKEEKAGKQVQAIDYLRIAIVVTALVVYSLVIEKLGYIAATLFLLVILYFCSGSKKTFAVMASILTVLITYFGFTYLGVRFPPGILAVFGL
jgi:putative tricarboxylic transport membrane protein